MHISAIEISNFRCLANFELTDLPSAVVVLGQNNSGKSNLLRALGLILDPALPDRFRELDADDFWIGCEKPLDGDEIKVVVELRGYDDDVRVKAALADCSVATDPLTARLTYLFRPRYSTDQEIEDHEWLVFGGTDETNRFDGNRRREVALTILPALRDAERDLQSWQRSPLREILKFTPVAESSLDGVAGSIQQANKELLKEDPIKKLGAALGSQISEMVGENFAVSVDLGVAPPLPEQVLRALRILVEGGYPVSRAGLGATNILYLALLLERLQVQSQGTKLAAAILGVEEPEAHLHPHVQRVLFRYLLKTTSILVTTHSAHIASVSTLPSLVMLMPTESGTIARRAISDEMDEQQIADLERYLDVRRADFLFARGVILVEGAAEEYLVPAAAHAAADTDLDALGITVCAVDGVDFKPYHLLLKALAIPHAVVTDGDRKEDGGYAGLDRSIPLLDDSEVQEQARGLAEADEVADLDDLLRERGIFVNDSTLEIEYARTAPDGLNLAYQELVPGRRRRERFEQALADATQDPDQADDYLSRVTQIGKGRFAQRAAAHMQETEHHPEYIREAIEWLSKRLID